MSECLYSFTVVMAKPVPPSVNELYRKGFRGKQVLTKKGEIFKSALTKLVVEECNLLPWKQAIEAVYNESAGIRLIIGLHVDLYNKSWKRGGGKLAKGKLQSPYKRLDGTNYIKVTEDAVASGTGIDDSANLEVTIVKVDAPMRVVELTYEVLRSERPWPRNS